jgi:hypothetical protein
MCHGLDVNWYNEIVLCCDIITLFPNQQLRLIIVLTDYTIWTIAHLFTITFPHFPAAVTTVSRWSTVLTLWSHVLVRWSCGTWEQVPAFSPSPSTTISPAVSDLPATGKPHQWNVGSGPFASDPVLFWSILLKVLRRKVFLRWNYYQNHVKNTVLLLYIVYL